MRTVVVYVHGLWMTGLEGGLLRRRLSKALNAHAPVFHYRSVGSGISANAAALARRLADIKTDALHLVGHSLGGLVIFKLFESDAGTVLPPGRVVLLGSPVAGSRAAHGLAAWLIGRQLLGRSVSEGLLTPNQRHWDAPRDLGVIAGTLNIGLGRLISPHKAPSDGTVFVDETRVMGMKEHLTMRVSHSELPFSGAVARQTAAFLRDGHFSP